MWRYQGSKTLSYYLRRRDCIAALAEDLGVQQEAAVPTVFKQVLESVAVRSMCAILLAPLNAPHSHCSACTNAVMMMTK